MRGKERALMRWYFQCPLKFGAHGSNFGHPALVIALMSDTLYIYSLTRLET